MINFLIRIICFFTLPIENEDTSVWYERPWRDNWRDFKCGSCRGVYRVENGAFEILAVHNTKKNKSFDAVLSWFEKSATRDNMKIVFLEVGNEKLEMKLRRLGWTGPKERMEK